MKERIHKSDAEWREQLTPEQYKVTRQHGTERAGTSALNNEKREGVFTCVCCGEPLFASDAKFESGTGWPSFFKPVEGEAVTEHDDRSFLMHRTEVRCARCDAHLGHVFPDGPKPTGLRYCMNGSALGFKPGHAAGGTSASAQKAGNAERQV
ncbi:MAG: peptide-methionine (R)-S-oxide reductase MsrB [Rhodomicrobium sp.]